MFSSKLIYQFLFGLVALSMRSSIAIATTAPTPAPTEIQPEWVPFYNTGTFASEDDVASNAELVEIWSRSPNQLIHRKCPACTESSHQDIYYRRFDTNGLPQYMDLLSTLTETWSSFGNQEILGQTFKLYSTYNDAINDTNAWTYCNYDLVGVGFPRECGVTDHTGGQYNSINLPSFPNIAFYVEALHVTSNPTEAPTASPTVAPTKSPTPNPTVPPTLAPTSAPTSSPTVAPTTAPTSSPTASPSAPSSTKAPSTSVPSLSTGKSKGSSTKSPSSSKAPKSTKSPKSAKTSKGQKSSKKSTKSTKTTTGSANNVTNSAGTKHTLVSPSYAMVIASMLLIIE